MGGMIKHAFWVAPVAIIILVMTWFLNRENKADIDRESAAFDRDWSENMSIVVSKTHSGPTQKYQQRAADAQQRYSSAVADQRIQREQMKQTDKEIRGAVNDIERKLK